MRKTPDIDVWLTHALRVQRGFLKGWRAGFPLYKECFGRAEKWREAGRVAVGRKEVVRSLGEG